MTKKTDVKLTHLQPATRRWFEHIRTKFVLQSHLLRCRAHLRFKPRAETQDLGCQRYGRGRLRNPSHHRWYYLRTNAY